MKIERAEILGLKAISHIVSDEALLNAFLTQSGADQDMLRTCLGERDFQASALDFLCQSDEWVLDFCAVHDEKPESLMHARHILAPQGDFT